MSSATLIDTTKCIGCRSCQVTCKQWNVLPAETTQAPIATVGLQNPRTLSAKTYVVVTHKEVDDPRASAALRSVFVKRQCMHCEDPACVAACPVTAMHKTDVGPVVYDAAKCIGCRYCLWACPWGVPTAQWDSLAPEISKCTMCYDRLGRGTVVERNGTRLTGAELQLAAVQQAVPACVKQCPAGALTYGAREELLVEARRRIESNPDLYVDHIYGEHEAGGTGMLYLAAVPFSELGFPDVSTEPYPATSELALGAVPPAVVGVGSILGGIYAFHERREKVAQAEQRAARRSAAAETAAAALHVEFAPADRKVSSSITYLLTVLMAFGGLSFVARFVLGLGESTNLSDTWAWGLWIVFAIGRIAIAAGSFATAALIYIFKRKELYPIGRAAVYIGLLTYSSVAVTLVADLGLPWHFWQLALNSPKHSAMFEVSWCMGLYTTILVLEFVPVLFERLGLNIQMETWRRYSPLFVVAAVALFVWLISHSIAWTVATLVAFGFFAYLFRRRPGEEPAPMMLAVAAVIFSTMHQSSLGSLFLLMPDKLSALWWSPMLPVHFFLSSVAAGGALMVLIDMWIGKAYRRTLEISRTAALGQLAFWALLAYEGVRVADLAYRGQVASLQYDRSSLLLMIELVVGGLIPLVLLSTAAMRRDATMLFTGSLLAVLGVIFNRVNVVLFAMTLRGPLPQTTPDTYFPSLVEWGMLVGPVAAVIYLFILGVRLLPILPKEETAA